MDASPQPMVKLSAQIVAVFSCHRIMTDGSATLTGPRFFAFTQQAKFARATPLANRGIFGIIVCHLDYKENS